jgi:hypothetical protein
VAKADKRELHLYRDVQARPPTLLDPAMTDHTDYTPPKVWTCDEDSGGRFAHINRPIAGPTHDKER